MRKQSYRFSLAAVGLAVLCSLGLIPALSGAHIAQAAVSPIAMWGFSEGTGFTTTVDASGNGNTATLSGATWTTSGKLNKALSFNGTTAKATVSDSSSLREPTTALTVSAWIKTNGTSQSGAAVIQKLNASGAYSYAIAQNGASQRQFVGKLQVGGVQYVTPATPAVTNAIWYYAVLSWTSGAPLTLDIYNADGTLFSHVETAAMPSGAIDADGSPLSFGENEATNNWKGFIDEVRIYDRTLSSAEIQTDSVTAVPDVLSPTTPTNLTATAVSAARINLAWTASKDNIKVTGYRVYRDGVQVATTTAVSYANTGLAGSTTYTYTVSGFDAAGNSSALSAIASATTAPDVTAPTISAIATSTSYETATITWTTNEPATSMIRYGLTTAYGSTSTVDGLVKAHSVTLTGLAENTRYYFRIVSADVAGNTKTSNSYNLRTLKRPDTTSPVVTILAPAEGSLLAGSVSFSASATDVVGVVGVTFFVDGVQVGTEDTSAPFTATWNTASVTDGVHVLTATARDAAGNVGTSADISVSTYNTAPIVSISANPETVDAGQTVLVEWSAENAVSCAATGAWTGEKALSGSEVSNALASSTTFVLTCTGISGLIGYDAVPVTVILPPDVTPPVISSVAASASISSATITWTTDEPSTSMVEYGPTTSYGSYATSSELVTSHAVVLNGLDVNTLYHFRVTSVDTAWNVSVTEDQTFQPSASVIIDHTTVDASAIPVAFLDTARAFDVIFQHRSIGTDIMDGLTALTNQDPSRYDINIVGSSYWWFDETGGHDGTNPEPSWFATHNGIANWEGGTSGLADTKITAFNELIRSGYGDIADVALMKFCFTEIWSGTGQETWDLYRPMMEGLMRDYPDVTFIWATMPLAYTQNQNDQQDYGRPAYDFNNLLRAYIAEHGGYLYDIADMETYSQNGTPRFDSMGYPALSLDWAVSASDPHLNAAGRARGANAWWTLMSRIAGWNP